MTQERQLAGQLAHARVVDDQPVRVELQIAAVRSRPRVRARRILSPSSIQEVSYPALSVTSQLGTCDATMPPP